MATARTKAVGRVACVNRKCDEVVIVRLNESGGYNCGCPICDIEVRHKKGTQSHADCTAEMRPIKAGQEAPKAEAKPAPAPKAEAKPAPAQAPKRNWLGVEV